MRSVFLDQAHIRTICTRVQYALLVAVALTLLVVSPARAAFGLSEISVSFSEEDGSDARKAGSHPYSMTTFFKVNTVEHPVKKAQVVDGAIRNLDVTLPAGFVGNPTAVPRCDTLEFLTEDVPGSACADSTALGVLTVEVSGGKEAVGEETVSVHNLQPAPGVAAKLGFWVAELPITVDITPSQTPPYNVVGSLSNTSQIAEVRSSKLTLWGDPSNPVHDEDRGDCAYDNFPPGPCPAKLPERPFLTMPRSCTGPLQTTFEALSWWSGEPTNPGPPEAFEQAVQSPGMLGCSALAFSPSLKARPTTANAESPSGLEVDLEVDDEGVTDAQGTAHSDIEDAQLTLPEGVTVNPAIAGGVGTCGEGQLAAETLSSAPGEGCPLSSKIGSLEARTPVLEGTTLRGALYIAPQDDPSAPGRENPFDSLLALHLVIKDPTLGLLVKQSGLIEPNPKTGQLITSFEDLPPFPLEDVRIRLREASGSPLVSPPSCGQYTSRALLGPSGDPGALFESPSSFEITAGVGGGPCPGAPPFSPGFQAGTLNNSGGAHSPFHLRLTRRDGDQDLTRFDATLPQGVLAKLAGVDKCPDAAIEAAKAKSGRSELAFPSCPANSRIGSALGGAGVGPLLTEARGAVYLAGPFAGAPLSAVGIVPAVAGPFDVGTVVVRQALQVNPRTGEVRVDGARSDPIPHILAGIPLKVRDIRVDVDRPDFTLNPTDCSPFATAADIWGGGLDLFSPADDAPVGRSAHFQAANCASLGFKPRLSFTLKGGTSRGGHPALRAVYRPRKGEANLEGASIRLPRSAFLDQAHIRTICTRVQFAAAACPKGAVYGTATATTPLLAEPLAGPVYLRSSDNELPDVVFDLHGLVDVEVSARVDSVRGGIRVTIPDAPDAPVTSVAVRMQGQRKGLIVNSRNLCDGTSRAKALLRAQNKKRRSLRPAVKPTGCGGKKRR
ncbi:MAG TPA: hypothetical protein VF729_02120 [Solirubrobacterales bacterium]